MPTAPIIFIHYGNSKYLKWTLQTAKKNNPDKEIILLGDEENQKYGVNGVRHVFMNDYEDTDDLVLFNKVFRLVAGTDFEKSTYGKKWTHFNFKKWFVLNNFLLKNPQFKSLWTFDSDVLVFENLKTYEEKFATFDYTVANELHQIFGFIKNIDSVSSLKNKIVELFQRDNYLKEQQKEMDLNPTWGFTIMRACDTFYKEEKTKIVKLFNNQSLFNQSIFCGYLQDGLENFEKYTNNSKFCTLYYNTNGNIYLKKLEDKSYCKVVAMNSSWMDLYHIQKMANLNWNKNLESPNNILIDLKVPLHRKIRNKLAQVIKQ